ncbi:MULTISPECIES: ATP synthase F0 subunit C [Kocuria]|uniref:ATP synthase subunit c n=3 Tax=Kocuria TaxID=57493 RepID=A0A1X7CHD9_9MICC|nr:MULTISPECIES: ATP synthase F0 subunit C [Kocuria]MBX7556743.1 ATP synthase F0 subunit C [Streptomyces sp. tea 10]KHE74013.1 ATP synthase subunit C [Kocuria marina]MBN6811454.1 ATP synthase F0 subunit C [Kocuria indica]MBN6843148.1 ATP synthase F0 subunit C [Kocuria indica]MBS6031006.1 ATP synthase F0 subunit C [Kocuria rhizophila]
MEGSLSVIGYGLAAIGGGIGVGLIFAAYMQSVARQPESQRVIQPMLFMGFAVVEALAILGFVLALL